ncbi:MAG: hypothetical protein GX992_00560 [Clostridium sp.]|nr:hypothetical protein [Clostridium sp.]
MKISIDLIDLYKTIEPLMLSTLSDERRQALILKDIGFLMAFRIIFSCLRPIDDREQEASSFLNEKSLKIHKMIETKMEELCRTVSENDHFQI